MSAIRDFFKKKKADVKFKGAGRGQKLSDSGNRPMVAERGPSSSHQPSRQELSEAAQRAREAALARTEQKPSTTNWAQQATIAQARKEIELENAAKAKQSAVPKRDLVVQEACPALTVSGVYFKCPIIGPEVLPKREIKQKIKEFLSEQLDQERGLTACLIIHTVNENKEKVRTGIETLSRYITNILDHPNESKYHKIRFNNKVFQERIVGLEGAFDFLTAAGFNRVVEDNEEYFVFDGAVVEDFENLEMLKEALLSAEPILPCLDRNMKVLQPSHAAARINLPGEFFVLSADEVKREQEVKSETVELLTQLRTKAMRERDELREIHMYKYTLIRIRFPNDIILQGTFYVYEKLLAVREFIVENLCTPEREFQLMLSGGLKLAENESLLELRLVPAVLLNFLWSDGVSEQKEMYLKPETMVFLEEL